MLLKALLIADLESAFVETESAAFLNSETHESLQQRGNGTEQPTITDSMPGSLQLAPT